ncbi:Carboxylesterase 1E [Fulvia fulva]|uniref:Carboxylesterase 1E n=1 Tax=Passalora fulva TaxID=5499 RepID=A0A9Q8LHN2_PASFU|nr:Carboxylesterase 1E [Fulvia fulva]KAK4625568.1 Carboxylesterase 1E [Fulvia fulva]UJO17617.1 Carboxylesterase 1E [Fulvia fulva]
MAGCRLSLVLWPFVEMLCGILILAALAVAKPTKHNPQPYHSSLQVRHSYGAVNGETASPEVDLGYSIYQGYHNASTGQDVYKGIRFAQPPTGSLRWQAPRPPAVNRTETFDATTFPAECPQNPNSSGRIQAVNQTGTSEDCLFLNVYTPSNATEPLPVHFWIHGGGYGTGNGQQDLQTFINTNGNRFVGVIIQYRLGAFGFLSSDEVYRKGVVNAGILDQVLALQWVQSHIHLFNGDFTRVTIAGESAGAGSVMLLDIAYGGTLGTSLFQNSIAASPFLPMQYGYKDWVPTQSYYSFAAQAGCNSMLPYGANGSRPIFECLQEVSSEALINASATIAQSGNFGTWAFLPVTDGTLIQDLPSRQLGRREVNGENMFSGNNANEGAYFVPQHIDTEEDLLAWLRLTFPLFSTNDIAKILYYYPSSNASVDSTAPLFATTGESNPTAVNQSVLATGQQQRANNIYAETTFICPSYWLAGAYSRNGGSAYKYQFSVVPGLHGDEINAWANAPDNETLTQPHSRDLATAFSQMYGNFVIHSNPSVSNAVANGLTDPFDAAASNAAAAWPPYSIEAPFQIDVKTTCGENRISIGQVGSADRFYCAGAGTYNDFRKVNAYTWEGGRGVRCDSWKSVGEIVPE